MDIFSKYVKYNFCIHKFEINKRIILYDVNTCCVCEIDGITSDIIDAIISDDKDFKIKKIIQKYGLDAVIKVSDELDNLINHGVISTSDKNLFDQPISPYISNLCLNISHNCDLDCKYCYAEGGSYYQKRIQMDKKTAENSIEFLIKNSGDERSLSVSFFGGEPLLNFPVLKHTVLYAKSKGECNDKNFNFHVTTNGIHLTKDIQEFLNKEKFSIIISLDGTKKIHNNQRPIRNGKGSYQKIKTNAKEFLKSRDPYGITIRGTFTGKQHNISDMMMHPVKLGFRRISVEPCMLQESHKYAIKLEDIPKIKKEYNKASKLYLNNLIKGNFFHFFHFCSIMDNVSHPIPQFTQCGAARGYVAVSPSGDIFPCHGLINIDGYLLGNVSEGNIDKEIQKNFHEANVQGKEKCMSCWARYFCGGGCHAHAIKYNSDIFEPFEVECLLFKHRLELGLWIYCVLAKDNPNILKKFLQSEHEKSNIKPKNVDKNIGDISKYDKLKNTAEISKKIKSDMYHRFLDEGIIYNQSDWNKFENKISITKNDKISNILRNVFNGIDIPDEIFERLLRPAAFGYLEAKYAHQLCNGNADFSEEISEIGALYVSWVCCFDEICDKNPEYIVDIMNCVTDELLLEAMDVNSIDKEIFLNNLSNDADLMVKLCIILWQSYINKCKELFKLSLRKDIWNEFSEIIKTQYHQQITCITVRFPDYQKGLWDKIHMRSSSPLWVNFLISFLSNDTDQKLYTQELKKSIIELGTVAKIIDDLIDLTDDLINRKWNYVLIKTFKKNPIIFKNNINQYDINTIQQIIDDGIIIESVDDACKYFNKAINSLKENNLMNTDFINYVNMFYSNWFKSYENKEVKLVMSQ